MSRSRAMAARILRNRDLRRLLAAFLAFNAAEFATWVAILLFAYEATGPASVGFVAVLMLVPAAVLAPAAAGMGDRYPRDRVLGVGYLAYGVGLAATTLAMAASWPVSIVYLVAALGGAPLVLVRPTQSALMPALSQTPDELTSANGAAGIIEGAGILLGPLIAAAVLTQAGPPAVFAISAAAVLGGAVLVARLRSHGTDEPRPRPRPGAAADAAPRRSAAMIAGIRAVLGDADARVVVGLMSARMLMIGSADVLFVLMALDLLGMGEPGAGILNAALGAGTIAGGATAFMLVGRGRLASVAAAGACLWGLAFGLSGWLASPIVATILIVVGGAGLAIVDVAGRTILQRSVQDDVLARVFGIQEGLAMAALAVGSLMVPLFVAVFGLTGAVLVSAGVLPVIVALAWSHLVALDARTAVPAEAIALLRRVALFEPLPAPGLEAIARRAAWLTVAPGTVVIAEGDVGDQYYVLSSGAVRVEREGRHLRDLVERGDGFGEIALLRNVPRTATVIARVETVLLTVDRTSFLAAVTGHPNVRARADAVVTAATMS
ncbi:MAG: MFS transporter [Chloroflexota bacterium]